MGESDVQLNDGDEHSSHRGPQTHKDKYSCPGADQAQNRQAGMRCFPKIGDSVEK